MKRILQFLKRSLYFLIAGGICVAGVGPSGPVLAQPPDQLVVAQGVDLATGDPQKTLAIHSYNILINIYDTLITRDADLNLKPGLATSWRQVDQTTWEFQLRRGVRFHNNEPFNAEVVKFSFERALDPRTKWPGAFTLRQLKSITIVNEYTVRFTTETAWPALPASFAYYGWIVPKDYVQKNGDEALARRPVGTGPYRFVRWVKDDRVELQSNERYWGGAPRIKNLVFRAIPVESTRLGELLAGSVHLINIVPPELFGPIRRSSRAKLVDAKSNSIFLFLLNLVNIPNDRPLADKRVRQALNYAIDRRALIASIMQGIGVPIATFCSETIFGCDMSIQPFPYDPNRARALLREAGYANGFDMTLATPSGTYPADVDITSAVANQLEDVGIRARPVVVESGLLLNNLFEKKLPQDAALIRTTDFIGSAGNIAYRSFHPKGGVTLWVPGNQELARLLEAAEIAPNETQAKDLYRRAQLLFKEEAPAIVLFTAPNVYGLNQNLVFTPRPDLLLPMRDASWR